MRFPRGSGTASHARVRRAPRISGSRRRGEGGADRPRGGRSTFDRTARHGRPRRSPSRHAPARRGAARAASVRPVLARRDAGGLGVARPGAARPGAVWPGTARHGKGGLGSAHPGLSRHGATQVASARPGATRPSPTRHGRPRLSTPRHGTARHGRPQRGPSWRGLPRRSPAQPGAAQPSPARPGTARRSPARRSPARRSPAWPRRPRVRRRTRGRPMGAPCSDGPASRPPAPSPSAPDCGGGFADDRLRRGHDALGRPRALWRCPQAPRRRPGDSTTAPVASRPTRVDASANPCPPAGDLCRRPGIGGAPPGVRTRLRCAGGGGGYSLLVARSRIAGPTDRREIAA